MLLDEDFGEGVEFGREDGREVGPEECAEGVVFDEREFVLQFIKGHADRRQVSHLLPLSRSMRQPRTDLVLAVPIDHLVRNLWDSDFSLDLVTRRGLSCNVDRNTRNERQEIISF